MKAFRIDALSPAAIEVLGQLFTEGPTWDGNLVSKVGCGELIVAGLALKAQTFSTLTRDGLLTAIEWDQHHNRNGKWYCKQAAIPWPRPPR